MYVSQEIRRAYMQFIIRVAQLVWNNLKCVWSIAPILMLLEIWALIRVIVILVLVVGVLLNSLFESSFSEWIYNLF